MTFPEFLRGRRTWFDLLLCVVFGHRTRGITPWHPMDEAEDRRFADEAAKFCWRCGAAAGRPAGTP